MTREGDTYPSLEERAALREKYKGTKAHFVSLHAEAGTSDTVKGIIVHYDEKTAGLTTGWRQKLAAGLQPLGRVQVSALGLAVLRGSTIPALCVSPGHVTNVDDLVHISDPSYQEQVAKIIVASME